MIYLEEGTEGIQILAFSVLAHVHAPVPCLHYKSLHGGTLQGGNAGGSRMHGSDMCNEPLVLGVLCQHESKGARWAVG